MKTMSKYFKNTVIASALLVAATAFAENVKSVDQPYVPEAAAAAQPDGKSGLPIVPADDKLVDNVIADNPMTKLVAGRSIATQLSALAQKAGWTLVWDTNDLQLDQEVTVSTDIVKTVQTIVEAANGLDTRLKAAFYRGNNVIRVTEY